MSKIAIVCIFCGIVFLGVSCQKQEESQVQNQNSNERQEQYCSKTGSTQSLSYDEAKNIAEKSDCVKEGKLKNTRMCNQNSGTWWIDLDVKKEGCSPACVIDVESKSAEINWRCTGLLNE